MIDENNLESLGQIIDELIEVSISPDLSDDVKARLDMVIDELVNYEIENNDGKILVPDLRDLSPEELEELKEFEIFVKSVMNDNLALA
tara:strand:- start:547 stop:810 length:264 start_codon:yes stop_codon:yes gene_type:complete